MIILQLPRFPSFLYWITISGVFVHVPSNFFSLPSWCFPTKSSAKTPESSVNPGDRSLWLGPFFFVVGCTVQGSWNKNQPRINNGAFMFGKSLKITIYIYIIYIYIHIFLQCLIPQKRLVGGWTNPFKKYDRQIGSFPQFSGWKIKKIFETTS